ncbi:WD repeat-containing protein 13 [Selaginella moellendorffii]|uniref:WD repeat-containing protein 13 n=1 Tax=Selaginella moellendorffii TaxID=88036 RepID=UPI000D1C2D9F|nr:WD repeat-containing protein 13 [Selaginella moellendorffii]|eukprot:XP_024520525.1 WD repeat-containing protein 13 [Selaginella moellendorffii]
MLAVEGDGSYAVADRLAIALEPGSLSKREEDYVTMRRLLLHRQAMNGKLSRQNWDCNGTGYVAYRKYICDVKPSVDHSEWAPSEGRLSKDLSKSPASISSRRSSSVQADESEQPAYAFAGMKCLFDSCKASVNVVRFGNLSSDLLAFGAADGTLTVCSLEGSPRVLHLLRGHSKEITDFDWSLNNKYLCSSSLDKSVRIWDTSEGHCIRVIYDKVSQLCIRFHPVNNNYLVVGTGTGQLKVINFSTGRHVSHLDLGRQITALDFDPSGRLLFAGDSTGCIYSIAVDSITATLSYAHKNNMGLARKSTTTTVQFRIFSRLAGGPVLLASNQDGSLRFFSVALQVNGYLTLRCSLHLPPLARNTRASFCPLLSLEKGEFIVTGSEDKNVYFYDFTRPKHPCVNKLQGHGAPIVGVSWNYGENLLASSDCEGLVIVWKRAKSVDG